MQSNMIYVVNYPDGSSLNYNETEWRLFKDGVMKNNCDITLFNEDGSTEVIKTASFDFKLRLDLFIIRFKYVFRMIMTGLLISVLAIPHFVVWFISGYNLMNKIFNYLNVKYFKDTV